MQSHGVFLELKLHDDLGDLELWLTAGADGAPLDLPADALLSANFLGGAHDGRSVELRARNAEANEDEDGVPNMREGGVTNYFIFPGETGADATWLQGEAWRGLVTVTFQAGGSELSCGPIVLVPHSHGDSSSDGSDGD